MNHHIVILMLLLACLCAPPAQAGDSNEPPPITMDAHWSVEVGMGLGATGENLLQGFAFYWPDYADDGAIGVVVLGGDPIPENHAAVGPAIEFPTGPIYQTVLTAVLPDSVAHGLSKLMAPVRPFAFAGIPFDEDFNPIALAGTGFHIWPNKHVQPTIRTDWIEPSGNSEYSEIQGWWTFVELAWFF